MIQKIFSKYLNKENSASNSNKALQTGVKPLKESIHEKQVVENNQEYIDNVFNDAKLAKNELNYSISSDKKKESQFDKANERQSNEIHYKQDLQEIFKNNEELIKKYSDLYTKKPQGQSLFVATDPLNSQFLKKKQRKKEYENTAGKDWYHMKAPAITPEIENDLKALQLRHIIDPRRFYKRPDSNGLPKFFQMGTIHTEITQGKKYRLKKNEVKNNLAEEFLENDVTTNYSKRKFKEIQQKKISLGRKKKKINEYKLKNKSKKGNSYIAK
jgi:hypothetical protein